MNYTETSDNVLNYLHIDSINKKNGTHSSFYIEHNQSINWNITKNSKFKLPEYILDDNVIDLVNIESLIIEYNDMSDIEDFLKIDIHDSQYNDSILNTIDLNDQCTKFICVYDKNINNNPNVIYKCVFPQYMRIGERSEYVINIYNKNNILLDVLRTNIIMSFTKKILRTRNL